MCPFASCETDQMKYGPPKSGWNFRDFSAIIYRPVVLFAAIQFRNTECSVVRTKFEGS